MMPTGSARRADPSRPRGRDRTRRHRGWRLSLGPRRSLPSAIAAAEAGRFRLPAVSPWPSLFRSSPSPSATGARPSASSFSRRAPRVAGASAAHLSRSGSRPPAGNNVSPSTAGNGDAGGDLHSNPHGSATGTGARGSC